MAAKYTHIKPRSYDDATYEAIEDYNQEQYGTFRNQFQTGSTPRGARHHHHNTQLVQSSDINTSTEGGYLDGSNGMWRSDTLALRDKPVILSDKTKTSIRYVWGNYTLAVVILFAITFPCGFCLLPLLPFLCTKKTKWMKDTEHVDPISNNLIGVYRRGKRDAPQTISFYRLANKDESDEDEEDEESFDSSQNPSRRNNNHRRSSGRRSLHRSTSQSSSYSGRHRPNQGSTPRVRFSDDLVSTDPIKLFITFKGEPVELPDGETTITRKRIGSCNLICAYVTYFLGFIVFPIPLLCFLMPCLKDTEHVHPRTKEIVGVNYKDRGILI